MTDSEKLAAAIDHLAEVHDKHLGQIADALSRIGTHLKYLGTGDESTPGAVEHLAITLQAAADTVAGALRDD